MVLKTITLTKRTFNLQKALLYYFLFIQTAFFYYFLFMFVIVCSGTCLASFIVFSRLLWIVQFPLLLRPTCNLSIDTFCCFDMSPFSFEQFFLTLTRVVLNQFNRTILNTEFIEYIYCGCLLFHPPFDVFLILFSMSFHSFAQTLTGAPNTAFIISNICNFANLSVFIPIHT